MLVHYFSDCPLLPSSIPNGVSNGTGSVEGSHHYFTCDEGFSLVGRNTLFCNDEGKWNGSVPTCVIGKPASLLILVLICKKGLVQYLFRPCKGMQHSLGFWIPRHRFRIPGTEFPDSLLVESISYSESSSFLVSGWPKSLKTLGTRLVEHGFRIPRIVRIPDYRSPYTGRFINGHFLAFH